MKILVLGDVMGFSGREAIKKYLPEIFRVCLSYVCAQLAKKFWPLLHQPASYSPMPPNKRKPSGQGKQKAPEQSESAAALPRQAAHPRQWQAARRSTRHAR